MTYAIRGERARIRPARTPASAPILRDAAVPVPLRDPVTRARDAGVTTVWTGRYSATVDLARLAGPRDGLLTVTDAGRLRLPGEPPWPLSSPDIRAALYECCLVCGTQFDIYRWVNLTDLAAVWTMLRLPPGVRHEWAKVLLAAGLIRSN